MNQRSSLCRSLFISGGKKISFEVTFQIWCHHNSFVWGIRGKKTSAGGRRRRTEKEKLFWWKAFTQLGRKFSKLLQRRLNILKLKSRLENSLPQGYNQFIINIVERRPILTFPAVLLYFKVKQLLWNFVLT